MLPGEYSSFNDTTTVLAVFESGQFKTLSNGNFLKEGTGVWKVESNEVVELKLDYYNNIMPISFEIQVEGNDVKMLSDPFLDEMIVLTKK
jgi:hypothetical protein